MPLMPFTEPEHISMLLDGRKEQTTRLPRKNPIKINDVLYCYFKPRHKKNCDNCITPTIRGKNTTACKMTIAGTHETENIDFSNCGYLSEYPAACCGWVQPIGSATTDEEP